MVNSIALHQVSDDLMQELAAIPNIVITGRVINGVTCIVFNIKG
jgi:hypothetical protein